MNKILRTNILVYLLLIIISVIIIFPIYWLFVGSLQPIEIIFSEKPYLYPIVNPITAYIDFLKSEVQIGRWLLNSLFVCGASTLISMLLSIFGAYSITRFKFKGKYSLTFMVIFSQMLPRAFLILPLYLIVTKVGLVDTHFGLMLVYISIITPVTTWFLTGFLKTIPKEIEEAALIDGCNKFSVLTRIMIPLMIPSIVATGTWSFILGYNEYIYALTLISNPTLKTVSAGVGSFVGEFITPWDQIMSAGVLATLPIVILFIIFQKFIISGMTAGSIKG